MRKILHRQLYRKMRRQRLSADASGGFTMIELLVVIAMMGFLAVIAAPTWQSFIDRQRMSAVRSDLMGVLQTAQDNARVRHQSKQVAFPTTTSPTPLTVTVRNSDLASIRSSAFSSTSGISFSSSSGIPTVLGDGKVGNKFRIVTPTSTPIVFDHNGRVSVTTPYVIKIVNSQAPTPPSGQSPTQSCVIVTTLLGGLKSANNSLCDSFPLNP